MLDLQQTTILIFSVCKNSPNDELITNEARQELMDKSIDFIPLISSYNGVKEKSFLVTRQHRDIVVDLCKKYEQECYLESGPDRLTKLIYPDGNIKTVGYLVPAFKSEIGLNWSYRPDIDQYYITKEKL